MVSSENSDWTDGLSTKLKNLQSDNSGNIAKSDIDKLLMDFLNIIDSYVSVKQRSEVFEQVDKISEQITNLKNQISSMGASILQDDFIPEISIELHSVVTQTEQSVIGILDVSDDIGKISAKINDPEIRNELLKKSTEILELCNFQDLTGQMIQRIIKRLTIIESTVNQITEKLGQRSCKSSQHHHTSSRDSLLNGPQKESYRPSQNQIDDLFNSLK